MTTNRRIIMVSAIAISMLIILLIFTGVGRSVISTLQNVASSLASSTQSINLPIAPMNTTTVDVNKIQVVNVKKITTEGYYGSPKWSPDGNKIYAPFYDDNRKQGGWVVMNPDGTGKQVKWDYRFPLDYSPDKTQYLYIDDKDYLGIASIEGNVAQNIAEIQANDARWFPAGDRIALLRYRQYYAISPDGSNLTLVYDFDKHPQKGTAFWGFAVSPDGKSLAVGSSVSLQWKKIDTGKGITIYTVGEDPIWSPDGRKIYSTNGDLIAFDINNLSTSADLANSDVPKPEAVNYFDINFNKGLIAYMLTEDYIDPVIGRPDSHVDINNIWIMDINGLGHRKITEDKGALSSKKSIVISPDGRYISYTNDYERNIYTIELSYQ